MAGNVQHFYPRSPYGERLRPPTPLTAWWAFLSTLSLRRATTVVNNIVFVPGFLSTLSLRRATLIRQPLRLPRIFLSTLSLRRATNDYERGSYANSISIHALLTESDAAQSVRRISGADFYPRSPYGERHEDEAAAKAQAKFLSTLSLRRATQTPVCRLRLPRHFYPRSPYGERPVVHQ